jgi:hypothetical protein
VYLYILGWYGEQRLLLREVKEFKLQKGKWHNAFYPFYLCISVFLVVCMVGWFSKWSIAMLDPSSV